jgi:hypothetical protein
MLTIIGMPTPPDDAEDLARKKVVDGASPPLFVLMGRYAEAEAIEPGAGHVVSDEPGEANRTHQISPSLLQIE